ncbi:hypothetical protein C8R46DRAFT_1094141 [Mycena filopes]|nr:hypothetical protein C8R46DRAFT_1094141 [Mycena filopes]
MSNEPGSPDSLSHASDDLHYQFWKKISYLTARTRTNDGWIGSPEVKAWNAQNMQACIKCASSRTPKQCIIDDDQASCQACRAGKSACNRKMDFLFAATKDDFFPTMAEFHEVFKARSTSSKLRTLQKTANKRRKSEVPYAKKTTPRVVLDYGPAISASSYASLSSAPPPPIPYSTRPSYPTWAQSSTVPSSRNEGRDIEQEVRALRAELRSLQLRVAQLESIIHSWSTGDVRGRAKHDHDYHIQHASSCR